MFRGDKKYQQTGCHIHPRKLNVTSVYFKRAVGKEGYLSFRIYITLVHNTRLSQFFSHPLLQQNAHNLLRVHKKNIITDDNVLIAWCVFKQKKN